ncbi:hypothetical protein CHUAL_013073 [Chamberlinius hualienensis]
MMARTMENFQRKNLFGDTEYKDRTSQSNGYALGETFRNKKLKLHLNRAVVCILTAVVAIYTYNWLFGEVNWKLQDELEVVKTSLMRNILWSVGIGLGFGLFTWMIIFMDSAVPGVQPPTPLSPRSIRESSGHTFHSNYLVAIFNGVFLTGIALWRQYMFDDCSS